MKNFTILLLLSISLTGMAMAQNLDRLPEAERNKILIDTAKQTVLKYGPGYYKDTHKIEIVSGKSKQDITLGRPYYMVTFIYNKEEELLDYDYAAKVIIWADTGEIYSIMFGNGWGWHDLDKNKNHADSVQQMPYVQRKKDGIS